MYPPLRFSLLAVLSLVLLASRKVRAYEYFQGLIPNGQNVKDSAGNAWPGVGHRHSGGGSFRNVFGQDFFAAGKKWTKELCMQDSDCDGLSNGYELGDPDCTWEPGQTPSRTTGITHPGFASVGKSRGEEKGQQGLSRGREGRREED